MFEFNLDLNKNMIGEAMLKELRDAFGYSEDDIKRTFICNSEELLDEYFKKAIKEDNNMDLYMDNNVFRGRKDLYKPVSTIKVTDVKNYNDRAVLVYFNDGTFTKAVCSENDTFDLDVGIQVCMMKKIFGASGYYKLMRDIHKQMDYNERMKEKEKEVRKQLRDKQKKREEKAAYKRQASIDQYKEDTCEAVLAALNSFRAQEIQAREDDLK